MQQEKHTIVALKDWVPQKLGFILCILFAMIFLCTFGVYVSVIGDMMAANQFYREDLMYAFQASMIGLGMGFPLMFRVKFRFSSYTILMATSIIVLILTLISAFTTSLTLLIIAGFLLGFFKLMGIFEAIASVQLIITPTKDFGIFYTVLYVLVLSSIQVSGMLAVHLNEAFNSQYVYFVMCTALVMQIGLIFLFFRHVKLPSPQSLKDIDWKGFTLMAILFMLIAYVLIYGQVEDWLSSSKIVYALFGIVLIVGLIYFNSQTTTTPFVSKEVFKKNVCISVVLCLLMQIFLNTYGSILSPFTGAIMKLDSLNNINLNLYIIAGILLGAVFCWWWYAKANGGFKTMFFIGFLSLTLYHLGIYVSFSAYADKSILYLPYLFRGIGNMVIYGATAKFLMRGLSFDIFPQGLFVVGVTRTTMGGVIAASFLSNWQHHKLFDSISKLALRVETNPYAATHLYNQTKTAMLTQGASYEAAQSAASSSLYGKVFLQGLLLTGSEIFGYVVLLGICILIAIVLYHFSKPLKHKKFPNRFWKTV